MDVLAKGVGAADPYLMGKQFTAADVIIGSGLRWGMMFKLLPERPEFTAYVGRLSERPALQARDRKGRQAAGRAGEGAERHSDFSLHLWPFQHQAPRTLRCTRSSKRATLTTTR